MTTRCKKRNSVNLNEATMNRWTEKVAKYLKETYIYKFYVDKL